LQPGPNLTFLSLRIHIINYLNMRTNNLKLAPQALLFLRRNLSHYYGPNKRSEIRRALSELHETPTESPPKNFFDKLLERRIPGYVNKPESKPTSDAPHKTFRYKLKYAAYKALYASIKHWDKEFCLKAAQMSASYSQEISCWNTEDRDQAWELQNLGYNAQETIEKIRKEKIEGVRRSPDEEERGNVKMHAATLALEELLRKKVSDDEIMRAVDDDP
jgi:hypothetical protein